MRSFFYEHAKWSRVTFGSDQERGPIGPLKHLIKEAKEALEAAEYLNYNEDTKESGRVILYEELADCQFLVFDAARRAGMSYSDLISECFIKLEKNKARKWNKPEKDKPVEHER